MDDEAAPDILQLEILFQDDRYIAINKPPGLLVHRSEIAADAEQFALQLLRDQINAHVFPVHRLDRPTSGILMFALDHEAMVELKRKFEICDISKTYQAITRGYVPDSGTVTHALRILNDFKGPNKREESQEAETNYKRLNISELPHPTERYSTSRYSHVELYPKTGRRHQLRRHLVHLNNPIIGDTRHGDNKLNKRFKERYGEIRLMLHATQLQFTHPFTNDPISIQSHVWPDMQSTLSNLELA